MDEALIVGGVAIAGNVTAVAVALLTTQRQAKADAERLHVEHLEADRRVRRDAYQRLITAISALDAMTTGYVEEPTQETFEAWLREFRSAEVEVALVESSSVRAAKEALLRVYAELESKVAAGLSSGRPLADALREPYTALKKQIQRLAVPMIDAMRDDLNFASPDL